jgi:hypothetical protein
MTGIAAEEGLTERFVARQIVEALTSRRAPVGSRPQGAN